MAQPYTGRLHFYYNDRLIKPEDIEVYTRSENGTDKYYYSFQINNHSYLVSADFIKENSKKLQRKGEENAFNIDSAVNIEKRHPDFDKVHKFDKYEETSYTYNDYATFFIVDYGYDKDGNLKTTCSYVDCSRNAGGAWVSKDGSYFFKEASEIEQDKISDALGFDDSNLFLASDEKSQKHFSLDDLRVKTEAAQTRFETGPVDIDAEHEYLEELEELSGRSNVLNE